MSSRDTTAGVGPGGRRTASLRPRVAAATGRASVPLAVVLLAALTYWGHWAVDTRGWSVMTDELQYVKLALGIGEGSIVPQIYGEYRGSLSQLYPALLAIPYGLFDMGTAFEVAHALNIVVMTSAGVPAYLLARHVTRSALAGLLVAAITVSVPWMILTTMLLTESVAYPASIWAVYLIQRTVAEPSDRSDLFALGGLLLAFFARTQLIVLALVLPVAILVVELTAQRSLAAVRSAVVHHRVLAAAGAAAVLAAAGLALVSSPAEVLGSYEAATEGDLIPPDLARWTGEGIAVVAVAVGVVPLVLALAWALAAAAGRAGDARHRSFAVILLVALPVLTVQATSFSVRFAGAGVNDRYLFYVVPLLLTGMAACLMVRRLPLAAWAIAGAVAAVLIALPEYTRDAAMPWFNSPAGVFHSVVDGRAWWIGRLAGIGELQPSQLLPALVVALTILAAVALPRLSPRGALLVAGIPVLVFCALETHYVFGGVNHLQAGRPPGSPAEREWVDRVVPEGATVAMLHSSTLGDAWGTMTLWWDTELYNRSVDRLYSYHYGSREYDKYTPFPNLPLKVDPMAGTISAPGQSPYLLIEREDPHLRFRPYARPVVETESGLSLLEMQRPYRARWTSDVADGDGWFRGRATVRLFGAGGEGATVHHLQMMLGLFAGTSTAHSRFVVRAAGERVRGSLAASESRTLNFDLCVPRSGKVDVTIDARGAVRLPNGELVAARLWPIETRPTELPCR